MKKILCALCVLIAPMVFGQNLLNNLTTVLVMVDTNSTLVCASPDPTVEGKQEIHYTLLENRGNGDIIFDWVSTIGTTNITVNGVSGTYYIGHVLRPGGSFELPTDKICNFPLSAISTNSNFQGLVAITKGFKQ